MHFYPHNIAEFNNATRHLTRVERSVYRDAIELYYHTESPLPAGNLERLSRVLLCVTEEEKAALQMILDDFFVLTELGYFHARCEAEIEKYRLNSSAKARAGKASAEARKNKKEHVLNNRATDEQLNNKQELINNKQDKDLNNIFTEPKTTPKKTKQKTDLDYSVWPEQPDPQILADWQTLRRDKRAKVSQTVIDSFGKEFRKAANFGYSVDFCLTYAIKNGWTGFEFQWMQNKLGGNHARQSNFSTQQRNLDHDDTSWADPLFGRGTGDRIGQRGISPDPRDIPGVVIGDQGPGRFG